MPPRSVAGFTIVELIVVAAIAGILVAIAYPSFTSQLRKSRRSDAVLALTTVQQAQERWRANNASYASSLTGAWPGTGLGLTASSQNGYYTLAISGASSTGYTVTATAASGKSQASDTDCTTLTATVTNGVATFTPNACWNQ